MNGKAREEWQRERPETERGAQSKPKPTTTPKLFAKLWPPAAPGRGKEPLAERAASTPRTTSTPADGVSDAGAFRLGLPPLPKLDFPNLEMPDMSEASEAARGLIARAMLELEKRGLVNASLLQPPAPPPPPEQPSEPPPGPESSFRPAPAVLDQLDQLSERAQPALGALRGKLPTVPGPLLRLILVLGMVVWVGAGVVGPSLPTGEQLAAQAQAAQARKGAQDMARVRQVRAAVGRVE
eukprot:scaffold12206_cov100-Isochrysis_galbana.AAC.1